MCLWRKIKRRSLIVMKKEYLSLEIELVFWMEDVITLSQSGDNFIEDDWN